jgi:hypothetical protein
VTFPPVPPSQVRGHFRGGTAIGDATYYVDALITVDRDVRMHVAGPFDEGSVFSGGGFPVLAEIAESVQFVGNIDTIGQQNLGAGVVLGQACAPSDPGRFCDVHAPASISLEWWPLLSGERSSRGITGEIRVTTGTAEESWRLDLPLWNGYRYFDSSVSPGGYLGPSAQFLESLAGFAQADDTLVTVDGAGRLFFQSPASGCVGNGTLARRPPHYVVDDYAFDVNLHIASCSASYASFNGVFVGLATGTRDSLVGSESWLLMFLSAPEGSAPRPAFTMLGRDPYHCGDCGWWGY